MVDEKYLENEIIIDIKKCARCSYNHKQLKFKAFNMPIYDIDDTIWNYWTMCPTLKEPILLTIEESNNG